MKKLSSEFTYLVKDYDLISESHKRLSTELDEQIKEFPEELKSDIKMSLYRMHEHGFQNSINTIELMTYLSVDGFKVFKELIEVSNQLRNSLKETLRGLYVEGFEHGEVFDGIYDILREQEDTEVKINKVNEFINDVKN